MARPSNAKGGLAALAAREDQDDTDSFEAPPPSVVDEIPADAETVAPADPNAASLRGRVVRVNFVSENADFAILRVETDDDFRKQFTCRGPLCLAGTVQVGDTVQVEGKWVDNERYGRQIEAEAIMPYMPSTSEGIYAWLKDGHVQSVGVRTVDKLREAFGDDLVGAIGDSSLMQAGGIDPAKADAISIAWQAAQSSTQIQTFIWLRGLKLGPKVADAIISTYGHDTVARVTEDPWDLCHVVDGVGFKTADELARALGVEANSTSRVRAGILHVLEEAERNGHCGLPGDLLLRGAMKLLQVPQDLVKAVAKEMLGSPKGLVVLDDGDSVLWRSERMDRAERRVAERLVDAVLTGMMLPAEDVDLIDDVFEEVVGYYRTVVGKPLNDEQQQALRNGLLHRISVVTGDPGTGKSFVEGAIAYGLEILAERRGMVPNTAAASPTGKAAQRQQEIFAENEALRYKPKASTSHAFLKFVPGRIGIEDGMFRHNRDNPVGVSSLLYDETGMLDIYHADPLFSAIDWNRTSMAMFGDKNQIRSVGPGAVFEDLLRSGIVPSTHLVTPQRSDNGINIAARAILEGKLPPAKLNGYLHVNKIEPDDVVRTILELVTEKLPAKGFDPATDIRVAAANYAGPCGIYRINEVLKEALNPIRDGDVVLEHTADKTVRRFTVGDQVIMTKPFKFEDKYTEQTFLVPNGQTGVVTEIIERMERSPSGEYELVPCGLLVRFDLPEGSISLPIEKKDLFKVSHGYCVSMDKMQGSEAKVMVTALHTSHVRTATRSRLYTTLTRAKKLSVVVGSIEAMRKSIANQSDENRHTRLSYLIRKLFDERIAELGLSEMEEEPETAMAMP